VRLIAEILLNDLYEIVLVPYDILIVFWLHLVAVSIKIFGFLSNYADNNLRYHAGYIIQVRGDILQCNES
jgi:hypothetical protein